MRYDIGYVERVSAKGRVSTSEQYAFLCEAISKEISKKKTAPFGAVFNSIKNDLE